MSRYAGGNPTPSGRVFKRKNVLGRSRVGAFLGMLVRRSKTGAVQIDVARVAKALGLHLKTVERSLDMIRGREASWIAWYGIVVRAGFQHGYGRTGRGRRMLVVLDAAKVAAGRLHLRDLQGRSRHVRSTWGTRRWYFELVDEEMLREIVARIVEIQRALPSKKGSNGHLSALKDKNKITKPFGKGENRGAARGGGGGSGGSGDFTRFGRKKAATIPGVCWWLASTIADLGAEKGLPALEPRSTARWLAFWIREGFWRDTILAAIEKAADRTLANGRGGDIRNPVGYMFDQADQLLMEKRAATTLTRGERVSAVYRMLEEPDTYRTANGTFRAPW